MNSLNGTRSPLGQAHSARQPGAKANLIGQCSSPACRTRAGPTTRLLATRKPTPVPPPNEIYPRQRPAGPRSRTGQPRVSPISLLCARAQAVAKNSRVRTAIARCRASQPKMEQLRPDIVCCLANLATQNSLHAHRLASSLTNVHVCVSLFIQLHLAAHS